jgi:large subunit ribosomal protein L3
MTKGTRPRYGSLQFYPRKRTLKQIHRINWKPVEKAGKEGILGFVAYKVGMATALVKDSTEHSMTKGKKIHIPVTILEAPNMKIFAVRFYRNNIPFKDVIVSADKELKHKLKLPKTLKDLDKEKPENCTDIKIIAYTLPRQTAVKKTPDLIEIGINAPDKFNFIKNLIGKEINLSDFLKYNLLDIRGVTKGKGLVGPVKRFGLSLKAHKSEKGVRRPGSLGPWHPARVTFRVPMAGQMGMFARIHFNQNVLSSGKISEKDINPKSGFRHYGKIKSNYIIIKGSVQGPQKRQVMLTPSFRPTKSQSKKKYELMELITK